MKTKFLLPVGFKKLGWVLVILSLAVLFIFSVFHLPTNLFYVHIPVIYNSGFPMTKDVNAGFFKVIDQDISYTLFNLVFVSGALMVAFSKLKTEDEYIMKIRLESLVWAVYANFIVILVANIAIYGIDFLDVLMLNMYTTLVLFIGRFYYIIYKTKRNINHAE